MEITGIKSEINKGIALTKYASMNKSGAAYKKYNIKMELPNSKFSNFGWSDISLNNIGKVGQDAIDSVKATASQISINNAKALALAAADTAKANVAKAQKALDDAQTSVHNTLSAASTSIKNTSTDAWKSTVATTKAIIKAGGGGQLVHDFNMVNLVMIAMRAAVMSMLDMNLVGISTGFGFMKDHQDPQWDKVAQQWWMIGGDKSNLNHYVDIGKNRPAFLKKEFAALTKIGFDGEGSFLNAAGTPAAPAPTTGALVAAAGSTIIAAAGASLTNPATAPAAPYLSGGGAFLKMVAPFIKDYANKNGAPNNNLPSTGTNPPTPPGAGFDANGNVIPTIFGLPSNYVYIGGAVVAGLFILAIASAATKKGSTV